MKEKENFIPAAQSGRVNRSPARREGLGERGNKGFTLAEVLITLVIIGVIGALTVPSLIQNTQKQEYVSALKKAYSTLAAATQIIMTEEGSPKCSAGGWACSHSAMYDMYKKYLNNVKECGSGTGCFAQHNQGNFKFLSGVSSGNWDTGNRSKLILADGTQVMFQFQSADCNSASAYGGNSSCGEIQIDVNGEKAPNMWGRDVFMFTLKETGLFPAGCESANYCCTKSSDRSYGCACKVITEGAMNY